MRDYKSCDNCYYEDFDPFAYPCAICIRGYERSDKWHPKQRERKGNGIHNSIDGKHNSNSVFYRIGVAFREMVDSTICRILHTDR